MARLRDDLAVHNERVKLLAGFLSAISLGLIGFAVLRPLTDENLPITVLTVIWGGAGLVMHGISHYILGMIRKDAPDDSL